MQEPTNRIPESHSLNQNYPNPFNPSTTIEYRLAAPARVRLSIFNILGQRVRILVDQTQSTGEYRVLWNGTDDTGKTLGSGLYFYRLDTETRVETRRMVMIR